MGLNFFPGRKLVKQFNIGSKIDILEYENILNSPNCQILEKITSTSKLGEVIVYIEYLDMKRKQTE